MKRTVCLLAVVLLASTAALAAPAERWLHVRVISADEKGETVRVNLPLSLAEKVLPAIQAENLNKGRLKLRDATINGVDLRALLDAVRTAEDNEFVAIDSQKESVRVAKSNGYLLVKVREGRAGGEKVDVQIPLTVVEALLSGPADELDLLAGIRALAAHGDATLVTVNDDQETVRVWVDSKNTSE